MKAVCLPVDFHFQGRGFLQAGVVSWHSCCLLDRWSGPNLSKCVFSCCAFWSLVGRVALLPLLKMPLLRHSPTPQPLINSQLPFGLARYVHDFPSESRRIHTQQQKHLSVCPDQLREGEGVKTSKKREDTGYFFFNEIQIVKTMNKKRRKEPCFPSSVCICAHSCEAFRDLNRQIFIFCQLLSHKLRLQGMLDRHFAK